MTKIKNISIVGGGTAGYIAALILNKRYGKNVNLQIIKSKKIGIIGVGEGSTEHFIEFINYVDIDFKDLIKECDATLKTGVMFENWSKENFLHSVSDIFKINYGQNLLAYLYLIKNNCKNRDLNIHSYWESKLDKLYFTNIKACPVNQFHFNTHKLNIFLHKKAIERGIKVVEDDIQDIQLNKHGNISSLKGETLNYTSDFYIDCTGFKRLLIYKLGGKWQSYKKYLKMKEAIAFPTSDTKEYNMYTVARAMDNGWLWKIPTYGRWGNGYIFDGDYINADQAKIEVEKYIGHKIEIAKHIKFDPGCIDTPWIKNCIAVGLSANFVEPLEATSIGTSINQIFLFTHMFDNYNEASIKEYNIKINAIMSNIRDFIILHYITKKNNTNFWKDLKLIEIPDSLKTNLEKWQLRLPILEDFKETNYFLFFEQNFINVLYGLNLLNIEKLKQQYASFNSVIKDEVKVKVDQYFKNMNCSSLIGHKEYLNYIRSVENK